MEANEQGLTTEERIMFAVLGIILVIAIGVLTFNYFSNHERKIEGPNTTEVEEGERKDIVDNKEHITSIDNLKEESNDNSTVIIEGLPNVTKTSNITEVSKVTKKNKITKLTKTSNQVKEFDEGIGSTDEGEVDDGAVILDNSENLDWTFNPNIVKESYANVLFKVPTTVNLTDGTEKEATVIIKDNNTISMDNTKNNEVAELIHSVPDNKPTPEDIAIEQETMEAIYKAMQKYFTKEELQIIAFWNAGYKYEEIIRSQSNTGMFTAENSRLIYPDKTQYTLGDSLFDI